MNRVVKWIIIALTAAHLLVALYVFYNQASSSVIYSEGDAWHMLYYYQFSQGGHMYYDIDLRHASDGYTPLASQIFGWTIRFIGNDIRWVRVTAGLFGLGLIVTVALIVYRLTGDRLLAFVGAGLTAAMDTLCFMELGPNTITVFFGVLGVYMLVRDPEVISWKTALLAGLAFFASYWSKQTGLAYIAAGLFYLFMKQPKKAAVTAAMIAVLFVSTFMYFKYQPNSRFVYNVFIANSDQPLVFKRLWDPIFFPLLTGRFAVLVAFIFIGIFSGSLRFQRFINPRYIFLAAGLVTALTSLKYGSGQQQAWFFYTMMIVNGLCAMHGLLNRKQLSYAVLGGLLIMQQLAFFRSYRNILITPEDKRRYAEFCDIMATPGMKTYHPNNLGYINLILGKEYYAGCLFGCWDDHVFNPDLYPKIWKDFLSTDPFDIVVIDIPLADGSFVLLDRLKKNYQAVREMPPDSRGSNHGYLRRKKIVFMRKNRIQQ